MSQTISLATRHTLRHVTAPHSDPSDGQGLEALKTHYSHLIASAGEDISRDGLLKTPERAAKAWKFLTGGYMQDPVEILRSAVFDEEYSDSVLIKAIEFHSLCEHHLLPFFGRVHVAYVPDGRIVGLSKIPRMIDALARRLQVQERLTKQIAATLESALAPKGIAVWVEASHMCMMMRGVEKQRSSTATSVFRGVYENDQQLRDVFLGGIRESR